MRLAPAIALSVELAAPGQAGAAGTVGHSAFGGAGAPPGRRRTVLEHL